MAGDMMSGFFLLCTDIYDCGVSQGPFQNKRRSWKGAIRNFQCDLS